MSEVILIVMGIVRAVVSSQGIPEGKPKSGRSWKVKQSERFSAQGRKGVLSHLSKSYEVKKAIREEKDNVKTLESRLKEEKRMKKQEEKERREERKKQRMANEFKSSQYQVVSDQHNLYSICTYGTIFSFDISFSSTHLPAVIYMYERVQGLYYEPW